MSTTMTDKTTMCACGAEADPDLAELAAMFPKLVPVAQCAACHAAEYERDRKLREALERSMEQSRREARLETLPPEMLRTRIDHPGFNAGLWMRVEGWQPSDVRWLGIVGPAGECKTRCLAQLAKRLILGGHLLRWTTAVDFQDRVDDLRGDRNDVKAAQAYLRACKATAILVLDDIGKNTWTPAVERHLFGVIDHRKTHDLPVLWTANTSPMEILASGQLTKDRGAPLMGRLIEASRIERA
jgi:DNA replication protein DnaC